jgi:hypothetical protein
MKIWTHISQANKVDGGRIEEEQQAYASILIVFPHDAGCLFSTHVIRWRRTFFYTAKRMSVRTRRTATKYTQVARKYAGHPWRSKVSRWASQPFPSHPCWNTGAIIHVMASAGATVARHAFTFMLPRKAAVDRFPPPLWTYNSAWPAVVLLITPDYTSNTPPPPSKGKNRFISKCDAWNVKLIFYRLQICMGPPVGLFAYAESCTAARYWTKGSILLTAACSSKAYTIMRFLRFCSWFIIWLLFVISWNRESHYILSQWVHKMNFCWRISSFLASKFLRVWLLFSLGNFEFL